VLSWKGGRLETAGRRDPSGLKPKTSGLPFQCVLFDCAGLIASPDNVLDELAQRAAIEALQRCAVVLFCVDSAKVDWGEDTAVRKLIQPKRTIHVATKADLCDEDDLARRRAKLAGAFAGEFLVVSAKTSRGLEDLAWTIEDAVHSAPQEPSGTRSASAVALNARHRQAVTEAIENVHQAVEETQRGNEEVAAMMIRAACEAISGIEQQHLDEQVLDRIFSRFCVGK